MLVQYVAIRRRHLEDTVGLHRLAARGYAGESPRHVEHARFRASQHHGGIGADRGRDPEPAGHAGDRAETHLVTQLRGDGILRVRKCSAEAHLSAIGAARIARAPSIDRDRRIDHGVVGRVARLQRREIHEQLPCRARLPQRTDRPVVIRLDVVGPAHHRQDRTIPVQADQSALRPARRIGADRFDCLGLQLWVDGGPNLDRFERLRQQHVELWQHPVAEIADGVRRSLLAQLYGRDIDLRFVGSDAPLIAHQAEHGAGAADGGIDIGRRRIARRRLDQSGNNGGLADGQVGGGVTEETATGAVHTVGAAAEIDLVEIKLENLLLGELRFERHGQHHFARLAIDGPIGVQEKIAGKLLRYRGGRTQPLVASRPDIDRAHQADRINPGMLIESPVLDRDHRLLHDVRDFLAVEPLPVTRAKLDHGGAVARAHDDRLSRLAGLQRAVTGQVAHCESDGKRGEQRHQDYEPRAPQQQALGPER